jgi:predicted nucleic acid-binding protein
VSAFRYSEVASWLQTPLYGLSWRHFSQKKRTDTNSASVQEVGTPWVRSLTHYRTGNQILRAHITVVEVTSAVARRRGGKTISSAQASSFLSRFRKHVAGRYTILEITPGLLANATMLANRHELRAYDAVQLAAALELNRISQGGTVLVSSDRDLN